MLFCWLLLFLLRLDFNYELALIVWNINKTIDGNEMQKKQSKFTNKNNSKGNQSDNKEKENWTEIYKNEFL